MRDFFTGRSRALPLIVGALVIVSDGAAAMQRGRYCVGQASAGGGC